MLGAFAPLLRDGARLLVLASRAGGSLHALAPVLHARFDGDLESFDDVDSAVRVAGRGPARPPRRRPDRPPGRPPRGITKPVGPHTLRHAFITAALDAGVPLRDVQEAASHADPRIAVRRPVRRPRVAARR
ncbi:MAG TPA: tyrosine-type recombinase/integrase [Streptosporangiaceae bacterium]|nr:tyrosine-type recombinase/integrase [Streptosporangiaceae bacterium]